MTFSKNNNSRQQSELNSRNKNINYQEATASEIETINLLEERLQVNRSKRKIGEVVIRKQTETRMIQIPIKREKLIVEKIGNNPEKLAEVVIQEEKINGFSYQDLENNNSLHITKSHYITLETAQQLLNAIANISDNSKTKVRLEIVTNCAETQIKHQTIIDQERERRVGETRETKEAREQ